MELKAPKYIHRNQLGYLIGWLKSYNLIGFTGEEFNNAWNALADITHSQRARFYAIPKDQLKEYLNQFYQ